MRVALRFNVRMLEEVGRHRDGVGLHFGLGLQMHHPLGDFVFLWVERPAFPTLQEAVPMAEKLQVKLRELVDDHFDIYLDPCGGYNFVSLSSHAVQLESAAVAWQLHQRAAAYNSEMDQDFESGRYRFSGSFGTEH